MPLAVLVLSESCNGTGERLDGGNLSALGGGARNHDFLPGSLVSGAQLVKAYDRSAGVCRRRKSGSDFDQRQRSSKAKEVELQGWSYPRHLSGRLFSLVVHGDAAGAETLRRSLTDWLTDMGLIAAGRAALVDSYIGYYKPYATSHDELDTEKDFHEEVRNAARALVNAVRQSRRGEFKQPDRSLKEPRPK